MLSQDEGKERKGAERLQAFEILQSKGSAVESASGNIFGAPLHPAALDAVSVRYFGRAAGERGRQIKELPAGAVWMRGRASASCEAACSARRARLGELPRPLLSFRISAPPGW